MSSCKIFLSRVCAAVFFGITTVSAIFVVIAFVHFNRAYKSTLGTLDRFTMSPIVEYEVHPTTAPLPSGLSHYPTRNWPGSSDGPCVCPSGARWDGKSKTSDWGICSTNQTRAGCRTGNGLSGMDLSIWRESFFGMRRAGPGAVYRNDNGSWVERPRQHNGTVCPDGWRVCGGFYNDTCMPYSWEGVDVPCPVQSALITASPPIEPGLGQTVTTLPGAPSLALVISRGVRGVQVLVDAVTSFGKPCIGDPGGQGWYSGSTGGSTRHEGCTLSGSRDHRWSTTDRVPEPDWMVPAALRHPDCFLNPSLEWMRPMTCRLTDTICHATEGKTYCERRIGYAESSPGDDWGRYVIGDTIWSPDCKTSPVDLVESKDELKGAWRGLLALMILNIIGSIITAALSVIVAFSKNPTPDMQIQKGLVVLLVKVVLISVTAGVVYVDVKHAHDTFSPELDTSCTDDITSENLRKVVSEVDKAWTTGVSVLVMHAIVGGFAAIQLLVYIIKPYCQARSSHKDKPKQERPPSEV